MYVNKDKIKNLRKELGLTQENLAYDCDTSSSVIIKIENGESKHPSITTMVNLADALGVNINEILLKP